MRDKSVKSASLAVPHLNRTIKLAMYHRHPHLDRNRRLPRPPLTKQDKRMRKPISMYQNYI